MRTRESIWNGFIIGVYIAGIYAACAIAPTPPTPQPTDARFSGFHSCTEDPTGFAPVAVELASACADRMDTAACFAEVADQGGDPTQLLCAARDVQVRLFADPECDEPNRYRRARLKAWLDGTGAVLRGQP